MQSDVPVLRANGPDTSGRISPMDKDRAASVLCSSSLLRFRDNTEPESSQYWRPQLTLTFPFKRAFPSKHDTLTNAGVMLGRRRRRRVIINPALGQCIVFAGLAALIPCFDLAHVDGYCSPNKIK